MDNTFKDNICLTLSILKEQIQEFERLLNTYEKARFFVNKTRDLEDITCNLRDYVWNQHAKEERAAGNKLFQ